MSAGLGAVRPWTLSLQVGDARRRARKRDPLERLSRSDIFNYLHQFLVFVGAVVSCGIFGGALGGLGGAIACTVLGGVVGYGLATGMDEPLSLLAAVPRWMTLIAGAASLAAGFGWFIGLFTNSSAVTPSAVIGALIGLMLCFTLRLE